MTRCAECGFDLADIVVEDVGARLDAETRRLVVVLQTTPEEWLRLRSAPTTWSPAEYVGHVADVFGLFGARIDAMLASATPVLEIWDHDQRVREQGYTAADVGELADLLAGTSARLCNIAARLTAADLDRDGLRAGERRTVREVLARAVHEAHHHAQDVERMIAYVSLAGSNR